MERASRRSFPPRALLPCALAAWLASSCSLMNLGDFDLGNCERFEQCDAINEEHGLGDDDCEVYQCRPDKRGCELRPRDLDLDHQPDKRTCAMLDVPLDCDDGDAARGEGRTESNDCKDNDCDGLIDEDAPPEPQQGATISLPMPSYLSYAQAEGGELYLALGALTQDDSFWASGLVTSGEAPPRNDIAFTFEGDIEQDGVHACFEENGATDCMFSELALAPLSSGLVGIGINVAGCADGEVRTALVQPGGLRWVLGSRDPDRGGKAAKSGDLALGVPPPFDPTTGHARASSPLCATGAQGARSPRIAALPLGEGRPKEQALAIWLAASSKGACQGDSDVVALALEQNDSTLEGGTAEIIGQSAGCTAPSVQAVRAGAESGYLLAFPHEDGIELVRLGRPNELQIRLSQIANQRVQLKAEASVRELTLAGPANGELDADHGGLIAAWREHGDGGDAVGFVPIAWGSDVIALGEPQRLERSGEISAGPVAAYAPHGFAVDPSDPTESTGGWLLLWFEREGAQQRVLALRVADVDGGRMLGAPFELSRGDARLPFLCGSGDARFEYGVVTPAGQDAQLELGALECSAMP